MQPESGVPAPADFPNQGGANRVPENPTLKMTHAKNCQAVKAALEKCGCECEPPKLRVKDVDFVVTPRGGDRFELKVCPRLYFIKKCCEEKPQLRIAFPDRRGNGPVCLYHHNDLLKQAEAIGKITHTVAWKRDGLFHQAPTPAWAYALSAFRVLASDPATASRPISSTPSTVREESVVETEFSRVSYEKLNARQKENHNFHKVAAIMADYGFNSMRLNDDWSGADFLAVHIDGETILRVQLKSALTIAKKYIGRNLRIAFPDGDGAYVFPHDEFVEEAGRQGKMIHAEAWKKENGLFQMSPTPKWARKFLAPYRLTPRTPKE